MSRSALPLTPFPIQPRIRIRDTLQYCPALAAVAVHLPPIDHPKRHDCERALAAVFRHRHHSPAVPLRQARLWLDDLDDDQVMRRELSRFRNNPDSQPLYRHWRLKIWLQLPDTFVAAQAKLYLALYLRLCRLEREQQRALAA
jgi:hypothetical protein